MQTDVGFIVTVLGGAFGIMAVMIAMFLWLRSEANNDRRHFQDIQREDRKELMQISRNLEITVQAIQNEMKDFHRQLLELKKEIG